MFYNYNLVEVSNLIFYISHDGHHWPTIDWLVTACVSA